MRRNGWRHRKQSKYKSKMKIKKLSKLATPALFGGLLVLGVLVTVLWQRVAVLEKTGTKTLGAAAEKPNLLTPVKVETLNLLPVTETDHMRGSGKLTWIEYSDLECPFCKQIHTDLQKMLSEYDGRIVWVYRHYPLEQLHPKAPKEAEAAECAAELGGNDKFWDYVDKVFEVTPSNNLLDSKMLPQIAEDIGLNKVSFQACLASGRWATHVQEDYDGGTKAGVTGTPGNFLLDDKGNAWVISGALPYSSLKQVVETAFK